MYGQEERRMTTVHPTGQACGFSFFHKKAHTPPHIDNIKETFKKYRWDKPRGCT
jgi:hypothetical protein